MRRRTPLDEQIAEVARRRANAIDLLVRALIDIDTCTRRLDVLLDRKTAGGGLEPADLT